MKFEAPKDTTSVKVPGHDPIEVPENGIIEHDAPAVIEALRAFGFKELKAGIKDVTAIVTEEVKEAVEKIETRVSDKIKSKFKK